MNREAKQLWERWRPSRLSDVIGQLKAVAAIERLSKKPGLEGRAYWISGKSGTGKSTLAWIIADLVADQWDIEEVDAGKATVSQLDDYERQGHYKGMGGRGKVFIVNEAHGLRAPALRQLLVMLERIPSHVVWIFTTTTSGQKVLFDNIDAGPLLSRCVRLELACDKDTLWRFALRAKHIAKTEGLDGQPDSAYEALAMRHDGNMRAMLSEIEAGSMLS